MESFVMSAILNSYTHNCKKVNDLALDTVAGIQIPLCNSLSTLNMLEFCYYLKHVSNNLNNFTTQEQGLVLTLLTDAATNIIKYKEFYGSTSYFNNIIAALNNIIRNMISLVRLHEIIDDFQILKKNAVLMVEYTKRLPSDLFYKTYNNIKLLDNVLNKGSTNIKKPKTLIKCDNKIEHIYKIDIIPFCLNDHYGENISANKNDNKQKANITTNNLSETVNEKNNSQHIQVKENQTKRKTFLEQFLENIPHKQFKHNTPSKQILSSNSNKVFTTIMEQNSNKYDLFSSKLKEQFDKDVLLLQNITAAPAQNNAFAVMMKASKLKFKRKI